MRKHKLFPYRVHVYTRHVSRIFFLSISSSYLQDKFYGWPHKGNKLYQANWGNNGKELEREWYVPMSLLLPYLCDLVNKALTWWWSLNFKMQILVLDIPYYKFHILNFKMPKKEITCFSESQGKGDLRS